MCNDDYSFAGYGGRNAGGGKERGPRHEGLGMTSNRDFHSSRNVMNPIIQLIDLLILVAPSISLQKCTWYLCEMNER